MSQGYNDFFNKAKAAKGRAPLSDNQQETFKKLSLKSKKNHNKSRRQKISLSTPTQQVGLSAEDQLRAMLIAKQKQKKASKKNDGAPVSLILFLLLGMSVAGYGLYSPEDYLNIFSKVEITLFGQSQAQTGETSPNKSAKNAATNGNSGQKTPVPLEKKSAVEKVASEEEGSKDLSYFSKLNVRKKELDEREANLVKLEAELHKQKSEIDKRIKELQKIRAEISGVLEEKVTIDQEKVRKLVDFYSSMKPQQAAQILGKINEDLAVEVLGQMKKKSAADVMNLLPPEKAQNLSEKFAGYKRR